MQQIGKKQTKLSEWNKYVMKHKGQLLSMKTLSVMYRKEHTVIPVNKTECKGKNKTICLEHQDPPCTWVTPKKPNKKGKTRKEYCTISRKQNYNLSLPNI